MSVFEKNNEIEKLLKDIYFIILDRMTKLDTKYYELTDVMPLEDSIVAVIINSRALYMLESVKFVLEFKLKNGKTISVNNLRINQISDLPWLIHEMDAEIKRREKQKNDKIKKIHFDNKDIIITDPCYVIKHEKPIVTAKEKELVKELDELNLREKQFKESFQKENEDIDNLSVKKVNEYLDNLRKFNKQYCAIRTELDNIKKQRYSNNNYEIDEPFDNMQVLGINNYIVRNTIYGDWSCTTFNTDTNESIGEFCADAGMVAVFDLEEVLKYNPDFDYHINKPWTTTLIKNFTGDVWFEVEHTEGIYEDTTQWHKAGDKWENDSVHAIGKGNINFKTSQTGL